MNTHLHLLTKLSVPTGKIDAVLDTDTYNEIDDQFALAYMLASEDKIRLKAIYAAPFFNDNSSSPADGMEKSYQEIHKILDLAEKPEMKTVVFRGSDRYLPDESTPVPSDAARHLVDLAMTYPEESPLYVVAIGAITNVASALLLRPEIRDHMVVVWLGGHSLHSDDTGEFNMIQDVAAARGALEDILSNYQGFRRCVVILVFDAYKVKGNPGSVERRNGIYVVYTKEAETADAYIEKTTYEIAREHRVRVVTSDGAEQLIILGHGALRLPAASFRREVEEAEGEISAILARHNRGERSRPVKEALERAAAKERSGPGSGRKR